MTRAAKCTVCKRPDVAEVNAAILSGRSKRAIADDFGASKSAVARHAQHVKRAKSSKRSTPVAAALAPVPRIESVGDMLLELATSSRAKIVTLATDHSLSLFERAHLQGSVVQTLSLMAKIEGREEITPARIMRHPAFRRCREAIVATLAPWPHVLKAFVDSLERFAAEGGDR